MKTRKQLLQEYHGRRWAIRGAFCGIKFNAGLISFDQQRIRDLEDELNAENWKHYQTEKKKALR